jgi:erythromycin esterase-like protein
MTTALDLGWTLWAYDAVIEAKPGQDPANFLTMEFTNWREREQAQNLCRVLATAPGEPLLVWTGNSHASKEPAHEWIPMGSGGPGPTIRGRWPEMDRTGSWPPGSIPSRG